VGNGRSLTRIAAAEKREAVVNARFAGNTWSKVAEIAGYSCAESAQRAFSQAMKDKPAANAEEIRAQESERIEYLWSKVAEVVENPPLVHSAIGKTVPDPRFPGKWLVDERAKVSAISEYRHLSESYRKLTGCDLGMRAQASDEGQKMMDQYLEVLREAYAERDAAQAEVQASQVEVSRLQRELARWEQGDYTVAELSL
jgi:hypothetical protein